MAFTFNIDSTIYNYLELVKKIVEKAELTNKGVWYYDISSTETSPSTENDSLVIKYADMKNASSTLTSQLYPNITVTTLIALKSVNLKFNIDDDGIIYLEGTSSPATKKFYNITNLGTRVTDLDTIVDQDKEIYFDYYTRYDKLRKYSKSNTQITQLSITASDITRFITFVTATEIIKKSNYTHLIDCLKYYYQMGLLIFNYNYINYIYDSLCSHAILLNIDTEIMNYIEIIIKNYANG